MNVTRSSKCIRLGVLAWMPHIIISGDATNPVVTGTMLEVMDIIAHHLGFCYKVVIARGGSPGTKLPNGSWTGVMADIIDERIAFTGLAVGLTTERVKSVDFTEFLYMEEWTAGFKRPHPEPDIAGFVKPYTYGAWLMTLFAVVIVLFASFLLRLITVKALRFSRYYGEGEAAEVDRNTKSSSPLQDAIVWTVSAFLGVSVEMPLRGEAVRFFTALWLMASFIISTVYRSNLNAMLVSPTVRLPFNSLEELVESGLPVWTATDSILHLAAKSAPKDTIMGRILTQFYGVGGPTNPALGIKYMNEGVAAIAVPRSALMQIFHSTFSETGRCISYVMADAYFKANFASILLQKGSPWKARLNPVIVRLRESGILNYAFSKGVYNATECLRPIGAQGNVSLRALEFKDFYGVFLVYAGGLVFAGVFFVAEIFSKRKTTFEK